MSTRFLDVEIVVKKGSIIDEEVDALVNAANSHLYMGGGVAGAIRRFGGREIEEEALKHAPVPIGEAIATTAGRLKAKHVIHAPTMELPGPTTVNNVYKAARAALRCAEEIGAKSVAVPGMGTGVGGVPRLDAAEVMVKAIVEHVERGTCLEKIVLVDLNLEMVDSFRRALRKTGVS